MKRQETKPPAWVLASIFTGVALVLLTLGLTLVYSGIHDGIIHHEIVCRPPPGKGNGMAAYGARAVKIGIGLALLGSMFVFVAGILFVNMKKLIQEMAR